jgi:hypothetical protein
MLSTLSSVIFNQIPYVKVKIIRWKQQPTRGFGAFERKARVGETILLEYWKDGMLE